MHASHIRNSEQWFRSYRVTDKQRIWTINELKLIWSIKFIVMWRTIFFFFLIILILQWYIFNTGDRIYSGYHYECIIMFFFFFFSKVSKFAQHIWNIIIPKKWKETPTVEVTTVEVPTVELHTMEVPTVKMPSIFPDIFVSHRKKYSEFQFKTKGTTLFCFHSGEWRM